MTSSRTHSPSLKKPGPPRPRRGWWLVAFGLGIVLLGAGVLWCAVDILNDVAPWAADERAYHAAVPCPPGAPADRADCLHTVRATVEGTVIREQSKNKTYQLDLSGPAPASGSFDMGSANPLLERLRKGDRVDVTVWQDYAIAVSRDGVTQTTGDNPDGLAEFATALALAALAVGAYLTALGGCMLAPAQSAAERVLPLFFGKLGKAVVGVVLAVIPAVLIGDAFDSPVVVAVAWLLLLPAAAWLAKRP